MKLFTPIELGPIELKNRVVMPAIHLVYTPEGEVNDMLVDFYVERARGGPGLIIVGGCPIDDVSGMHGMTAISDDRHVPGLSRLAAAVHDGGAKIAVQLYQPGRYAFSGFIDGKQSVSASAVRSKFTGEIPRELAKDEIKWVVGNFAAATKRAKEAGFDAVEILGSAGYLISQFLSPITNMRTDEYGGDFECRMRFGLEVAEAVREAAGPDMAVIIRLAGHDYMPGSNTNTEAALFAVELEKKGVDGFNITGGWHETRVPQIPMNVPRGGYVYLAQGVKEAVKAPVIACNRINDPLLAEKILSRGRADMIGVARGFIADPEWAVKAEAGRAGEINYCIGCNQGCFDHVFALKPVECMVNPRAGHEGEIQVEPAEVKKKIMVVGGGPAGLTFARTAAGRGHEVVLYEKNDSLGGQVKLAAALPERKEMLTMIRSAEALAKSAGVEIRLNHEAGLEDVDREKPDAVVIAAGGEPLPAPFPGGDEPHVVQAWDVLADRVEVGRKVVVIGGGAVGCEAALFVAHFGTLTPEELHFLFLNNAESTETLYQLASKGLKDVALIEMTGRIGSDIGQTTGWIVRQDLARAGIKIMTHTKALEVVDAGVMVEKNDEQALVQADTIILAVGAKSDNSVAEALKGLTCEIIAVGDADKPGKAFEAVHGAFAAALKV